MRFKIIAKRYQTPFQLLVLLGDGRTVRVDCGPSTAFLDVGSTGVIVEGSKGPRFMVDAIDAE